MSRDLRPINGMEVTGQRPVVQGGSPVHDSIQRFNPSTVQPISIKTCQVLRTLTGLISDSTIQPLSRSLSFFTAYAPPAAASRPRPPSMGVWAGLDGGGGGCAQARSGRIITAAIARIRSSTAIVNLFKVVICRVSFPI